MNWINLFQFHTGSIKAQYRRAIAARLASFNSTLVRLKPLWMPRNFTKKPLFQFHTGSIKAIKANGHAFPIRCFNSTLVRLKRVTATIKASNSGCFNSTLVRLKPTHQEAGTIQQFRFNSTLVRLKRRSQTYLLRPPGMFQFHTGSIKAPFGNQQGGGIGMFQFHTGSIKAFKLFQDFKQFLLFQFHTGSIKAKRNLTGNPLKTVSIPHWFD